MTIAVVTGGSRGLGRSTVLALAKLGVHCIFTYNSNKTEADKVVQELEKSGAKGLALQLDVAKIATFDDFVAAVKQACSTLGADRIDYLVNNAGTGHHASFAETTEADLDNLYHVHFKAVFFLTQKLLPVIKDGGRIITISSGLARFSMPGSSAYAAMKGAVEVLTRYLAKELGSRQITANCVAPGAIATDFNGGNVRDDEAVSKMISSVTALGRPGEPEDIGPMIASLLTDANRWINGQRIEVSGGMFL